MVFNSLQFIFIFIPIFFLLYYLVPARVKNTILLLGSLIFYFIVSIKNPEYLILLLVSIMAGFAFGELTEISKKHKKLCFVSGTAFHIACLVFFKYSGFISGEMGKLMPSVNVTFDLVLPAGISFYTFQGISYLADIYKGRIKAEKSLREYAVYIVMFPKITAGPITTYPQMKNELYNRQITRGKVLEGMGTFIFGLGLKTLLANPTGKMWTQVCTIGFESISTPLAWMAVSAFSLSLYFDFFGYSLMAAGLGRMLGFELPANFDHPYLSRSMTEFWRRWHMTLGAWFREYVYIPLGGNRRGTLITLRNLLAVWLLTGIWHGAGYNYILWGMVLFVIIASEKLFTAKYLKKHRLISHVYMTVLIMLTWAIFAVNDLTQLKIFFTRLFPFFGQGMWSVFRGDYIKYLHMYYPFLIFGVLFSTRLPYDMLKRQKPAVKWAILILIFICSVLAVKSGAGDPFFYSKF